MADTNTTTEQGWFIKPTVDTITYFENLAASFYEEAKIMVDTTYVKLNWMDAKGQALNVIIPFTQAANGQKEWNEAIANGTGSVIQDLAIAAALTAGYLTVTGTAVVSAPVAVAIGGIALHSVLHGTVPRIILVSVVNLKKLQKTLMIMKWEHLII